jgi:hypothetical protein
MAIKTKQLPATNDAKQPGRLPEPETANKRRKPEF